jgi:hypothetical protein
MKAAYDGNEDILLCLSKKLESVSRENIPVKAGVRLAGDRIRI